MPVRVKQHGPEPLLFLRLPQVHAQPQSQLPSPEQVSLTREPSINVASSPALLGYLSFQKLPVLSSSSSIRANSETLPPS